MKKVSLKQVVNKCIKDPKFYRALRGNPEKALAHDRMHLTARDLKKLQRLTAKKGAMDDFDIYVKLIKKYAQSKYARAPQGILW